MIKYALLFSGGAYELINHPRYANNLIFAYRVLSEKLHYLPENITVIYADGKNLSNSNLIIPTYSAKKEIFMDKMKYYSELITPNDLFVFVVSNHGEKNGEIYTYRHDLNDTMSLIEKEEVIDALNNINCKKVIVLGQCYGGNYTRNDVCIKNSVILSASEPDTMSYRKCKSDIDGKFVADTDNDYDEFLYNFFSYYNGSYPCGKLLNCGKPENTLSAAFEYAKNNDFLLNGKLAKGSNKIYIEIPQIKYNINGNVETINL
jgi:hypothetical protein